MSRSLAALSLDCLTLPDVGPQALIDIAAATGFGSASLWVQPPAFHPAMLATPEMQVDLAKVIAATGVTLGNLEIFNLNTDAPISDYEPALAFGAGLGARSATAINYGGARADIAERLVEFHELCRRHGLDTYIEPISMGQTRTLQDGVDLIEAAGVDARLVVDCLHLIRTGGGPKTVANVASRYIGYVQLCDGILSIAEEEILSEAGGNRLYPGEGQFPLVEILDVIPPHAILGVETPSKVRMDAGLSPLDRARQAHDATHNLFAKLEAV